MIQIRCKGKYLSIASIQVNKEWLSFFLFDVQKKLSNLIIERILYYEAQNSSTQHRKKPLLVQFYVLTWGFIAVTIKSNLTSFWFHLSFDHLKARITSHKKIPRVLNLEFKKKSAQWATAQKRTNNNTVEKMMNGNAHPTFPALKCKQQCFGVIFSLILFTLKVIQMKCICKEIAEKRGKAFIVFAFFKLSTKGFESVHCIRICCLLWWIKLYWRIESKREGEGKTVRNELRLVCVSYLWLWSDAQSKDTNATFTWPLLLNLVYRIFTLILNHFFYYGWILKPLNWVSDELALFYFAIILFWCILHLCTNR